MLMASLTNSYYAEINKQSLKYGTRHQNTLDANKQCSKDAIQHTRHQNTLFRQEKQNIKEMIDVC